MTYQATIGLEIHAELKPRTKMFCACRNAPDEPAPNRNICPVCMAHPGTLPVINKEAVHKVLMVGTALGGTLADKTVFDRKNYFYPDIPKGYQISQYKDPLVAGGTLSGVAVTRVHLEEDTARSIHTDVPRQSASSPHSSASLIDYNRAGVPLMELVTEPVIHTAEDAGRFARELQLLLRTLGAGEANLEKGEMRIEANISVSRTVLENGLTKDGPLGTKVEVKNLNSFRSVERAIAFELTRQETLLKKGGAVEQETRGWDETKQETYLQRKKESSHDYRYFPEPDLPELRISEVPEFSTAALAGALPELPWQKRERYAALGVPQEYVEMFISDERSGYLFEKTCELAPSAATLIANYIGSDIAGLVAKSGDEGLSHITPQGLAAIMGLLRAGEVSSRGAKDAIAEVFASGGDLAEVSTKYLQESDAGALEAVAKKVIEANPSVAAEYTAGKLSAMQFLVGQGMKESKGSANPAMLREALEKALRR